MCPTTFVYNWQEGPKVRQFFHTRLVGLADRTRREYELALGRWTDYICKEFQISPQEINYAKLEPVAVWDHTVYRSISVATFQRFVQTLSSPGMVFRTQYPLHVYFSYLVVHGHLRSNPVQRPDYRETNHGRTRSLPIEELRSLFRVIQGEPIHIRAPLIVQAASGMRVGEITALEKDDIERLPGGLTVYIRHGDLKSRKALARPLPRVDQIFIEYLCWRNQLKLDTPVLFLTSEGVPWTVSKLNTLLARLGEAAHCHRKVTTHDLRRGYAATLSQAIGHSGITRQLFDHQEPSTTQFYTAIPNLQDVRDVIFDLDCVKLANRLARDLLTRRGDDT